MFTAEFARKIFAFPAQLMLNAKLVMSVLQEHAQTPMLQEMVAAVAAACPLVVAQLLTIAQKDRVAYLA